MRGLWCANHQIIISHNILTLTLSTLWILSDKFNAADDHKFSGRNGLERGGNDPEADVFLGHFTRPNSSFPDGVELVVHNTSRAEFLTDRSNLSRWAPHRIKQMYRRINRERENETAHGSPEKRTRV